MAANAIPERLSALIRKTWPEGVVEEFNVDESRFYRSHSNFARDLGDIPGATLAWQTPTPEERYRYRDSDDDFGDASSSDTDFQSYHLFFLVPDGNQFRYKTESEYPEPPEDPEEEDVLNTVPGEGEIGCVAAVCLIAPVAMVDFTSREWFEDGGWSDPGIDQCFFEGESGERITAETNYRSELGSEAFQKLESLCNKVAAVLRKHRLQVLDSSVLRLPVPRLKASEEVFLQKPIHLGEAFFFRGV